MTDIEHEPVSTQPKNTVPMSAGGNRNALNYPIGSDGKRNWSYGLFDCPPAPACSLCCIAALCPCVVYSSNRQRLRSLHYQGAPLAAGAEKPDEHFCIYCGLAIAGHGWVLRVPQREEVREHYGIRGSLVGDCLVAWCCNPCSLTQERREIELEEGYVQ